MTEERIAESHEPEGGTHTHTTVIRDDNPDTGGGAFKWIALIVLVVAVIAAIYIFSQGNSAEVARDNAIAEAAGQVGDAAEQAGDTVEQVGDAVTEDE